MINKDADQTAPLLFANHRGQAFSCHGPYNDFPHPSDHR